MYNNHISTTPPKTNHDKFATCLSNQHLGDIRLDDKQDQRN